MFPISNGMRIIVKATKLDVTPALSVFIESKFKRLAKYLKHYDDLGSVVLRIEVARETRHHQKGDVFYAEANLDIPGRILRAESSLSDMRLAVSEVYKKLEGELKKEKGKRATKRTRRKK